MALDKKVLLLADESPFEREREPLARRLDQVLAILATGGWLSTVVTVRSHWDWHERLAQRGIGAHSLMISRYSSLPLASWRLSRVIGMESPAIVHAFGPFCALISGFSRYLASGPLRLYDRSHISGNLRLNMGSRLAAELNDHTMARSRAVRQAAMTFDRTEPERILVAFDGAPAPRHVPEDEAVALRKALGIGLDDPVVAIIARIRPEKGHLTLLAAMRELAANVGARVHLLLVGAGPYEAQVSAALHPNEPFKPHLVGYQQDIAPYLAISDVVAIPSYQDASPKIAAEAMAAGRPVVASAVGGLREQIVDSVSGILIPPRDPQALASAMLSILQDPDLSRRLGEAGLARYRSHFTLEERTARWMRCYEKIMA